MRTYRTYLSRTNCSKRNLANNHKHTSWISQKFCFLLQSSTKACSLLPHYQNNSQNRVWERGSIAWGHLHVIAQDDGQVDEGCNGRPCCVNHHAVLNLEKHSNGHAHADFLWTSASSRSHDGTNADFCQTNQHAEEPQVCVVVLMEPSSINMETVADKEHHGVVGADDQDQKNKSGNHHPVCTSGNGGKHNLTMSVSDIFRTNQNKLEEHPGG